MTSDMKGGTAFQPPNRPLENAGVNNRKVVISIVRRMPSIR